MWGSGTERKKPDPQHSPHGEKAPVLGLRSWLSPAWLCFPMEWDKCVGWGQEPGKCEETIRNSSTDQVPFEGKLKRKEGNLSVFLCFVKIRGWEVS